MSRKCEKSTSRSSERRDSLDSETIREHCEFHDFVTNYSELLNVPEKILGYTKFFKDEFDAFQKFYEVLEEANSEGNLEESSLLTLAEALDALPLQAYCELDMKIHGDNSNIYNKTVVTPKSFTADNNEIEFASKDIKKIGFSGKGRGLVATRDLPIDTVIIKEKATVLQVDPCCTCLSKPSSLMRCHHCAFVVDCFFTCPNCNIVIYCSLECLELSYQQYHKYECEAFQRHFWKLNDTNYSYMAFRMLMYAKSHGFVHTLTGKWGNQANNYPFIYHLESNFDQMPVIKVYEILKEAAKTVVYLMIRTNFFHEFAGDPKNLRFLVGGYLVKHYCQAKMNSILVKYRKFGDGDEEICNTGKAMCPTIALLNHACIPNAIIRPCNDTFLVITTRPIKANTEITVAYQEINPFYGLRERQTIMTNYFYFQTLCKCSLCVSDANGEEFVFNCRLCKFGAAKKITQFKDKIYFHCKICNGMDSSKQLTILESTTNLLIEQYRTMVETRNKKRANQGKIKAPNIRELNALHSAYQELEKTYSRLHWRLFLDASITVFHEFSQKYIQTGDHLFTVINHAQMIFNILDNHFSGFFLPVLLSKIRVFSLIVDSEMFLREKRVDNYDEGRLQLFMQHLAVTHKRVKLYYDDSCDSFFNTLRARIMTFMHLQQEYLSQRQM